MIIVVATSVLLGREAFAPLGEVRWLAESAITPESVRDADAVITRTKTRLNAALLAGSRVRFAATCTAGTDHMDMAWLASAGITAASAPGCNSEGVAQWFTAATLELSARTGCPLEGRTVGIVGHGHVGKKVERMAGRLGLRVLRCDPPLADAGGMGYAPLDTLLEQADILTLHVPLVEEGPHPTRGLLDAARIARLKPGAWLLNACRGEVLDGPAAAEARRAGRLGGLALDVWDPEPDVPADVLDAADLGTSHIAGHSLEGRLNGTAQAHDALCAFLGRPSCWHWRSVVEDVNLPAPALSAAGDDPRDWVRAVYDITEDDRLLRAACAAPDKVKRFRLLRDEYRVRREFAAIRWQGRAAPALVAP